jgi:hypothetical protein
VPVFNVYVDEAGDEGFVFNQQPPMGSSRWFIVAGVIVRQDEDLNVSHAIDRIKDRLQWSTDPIRRRRALHWRKLGHAQKLMVSGELAQEPLTSVHVCMWKERFLSSSPLRDSELLYHYSLRLLLERASWFVHRHNGQMRVIISNRARFRLDGLREYVRVLQSDPRFQGRPVFEPDHLTVTRPDLQKMLQIADAFASATLNALDPNQFGDTEPRYLQRIEHCLYRHGASRRLWSYGLKIFPSDSATRQAVLDTHPWLRDLLRE